MDKTFLGPIINGFSNRVVACNLSKQIYELKFMCIKIILD
jgi:hypothetical protein